MTNELKESLEKLTEEFSYLTNLDKHCECIESALDAAERQASHGDNLSRFLEFYKDEYIHTASITYYSNAMEFLTENDTSLRNSLEIAQDMGYEPGDLSSKTLANLLLTDILLNELNELEPYLQDYFDTKEQGE